MSWKSLIPKDDYLWCLHCERACTEESWQEYCPNCNALPLDSWSWKKVSTANSYPVISDLSTEYPLYPKSV